ncbi:YigZ family protein [Ginsengibacter hankyongi]|uniref:YigZ family protein n=1 Tax=Ginsengibacter hankyongi TaxID=2607284 RepID=A0A5J5IJY5_9BACT|nr:YigZ family protein [Ginsengibacter hankyongi]KAA9041316.1 YigZ family protein [Ginsengibacter hankyongi]
MDFYFTINKEGFAEYKDRGSKFLAFAYPIKNKDEFKTHLQALKKEHPKAVHHCFAYRIGYDGNNFRVSDDREPSGTAGKQILSQLDSKNLCNILVIVVRYFGGTLLGVPGLINAYKTVTSLVLQCTEVVKKSIEVNYNLQFNYTEMNEVMRILKQYNCTVYKNENQLFCKIEAGIPKDRLTETLYALENILHIEIQKIE